MNLKVYQLYIVQGYHSKMFNDVVVVVVFIVVVVVGVMQHCI